MDESVLEKKSSFKILGDAVSLVNWIEALTLHFVFSSGLLQDITYDLTKIIFDYGEESKIAHAILTVKFSHIIAFD